MLKLSSSFPTIATLIFMSESGTYSIKNSMTPFTGISVVASDDITIYSVKRVQTQSNPPSEILSASIAAHSVITVNDAGVTQYAVKEVQSLKVYIQENVTTITLLSTPTTQYTGM